MTVHLQVPVGLLGIVGMLLSMFFLYFDMTHRNLLYI